MSGGFRFGEFELDVAAYTLRRTGQRIKLEKIPMELLTRRPFTISRLSPNGRRVAFTALTSINAETADISTYDITTDRAERASFEPYSVAPIWTPDGLRVSYTSTDGPAWRLLSVPADGTTPPQLLVESRNQVYGAGWTPDSRTLLYLERLPGRNQIMEIERQG